MIRVAIVIICNIVILLSITIAAYQEFRPSDHKDTIQTVTIITFAIAIIIERYIIWTA